MSAKKKPAVPKTPHRGRRRISEITHISPESLETIPAARKVWADTMRLYDTNAISSAKARDLNSFFRTLLSFQLAEREADLEQRIERIEAALLEQGRGPKP